MSAELIREIEAIDPSKPASLKAPADPVEEVERLAAAFAKLLERIEAERRRAGRLQLRAQEEERKRVARDLHDEVNQALTAILLRLEALTHVAPPRLRAELAETKGLANQAMGELLQLARQLRPTALDDHGFVRRADRLVEGGVGQADDVLGHGWTIISISTGGCARSLEQQGCVGHS